MGVIWKTKLQPLNVQKVMVPRGSMMLSAREQFEEICIWYRCDPTAEMEPRVIALVGTGDVAPDSDARFLGTVSLRGGNLIFHVFEQTRG